MRPAMPSRKDPIGQFLRRSHKYVSVGLLVSLIFTLLLQSETLFPANWLLGFRLLPNWFDIVVCALLTIIMIYSFSYATGVLTTFVIRRALSSILVRLIMARENVNR